jgi:hypothetical protein
MAYTKAAFRRNIKRHRRRCKYCFGPSGPR